MNQCEYKRQCGLGNKEKYFYPCHDLNIVLWSGGQSLCSKTFHTQNKTDLPTRPSDKFVICFRKVCSVGRRVPTACVRDKAARGVAVGIQSLSPVDTGAYSGDC